jgi:hypothetical protein
LPGGNAFSYFVRRIHPIGMKGVINVAPWGYALIDRPDALLIA